jgi:N-acetylglucosamine-6-phosphate deacetylase
MLTQIINAKILTPQGWLKDGSVLMRDNKILEVTNCDLAVIGAELIDAKGMYVVPGGVEIHCHGGGGGDFMEGTEEAFRTAINAHMKHGTTSIFPTLSSSTVPMIEAAAETCTRLMAEPDSPVMTTSLLRGISTSIFFRLLTRAPFMMIDVFFAIRRLKMN